VAKELEQSAHPLPDTWRKRYAEKGLLGINSPSEYGGASRRAARLGGVRAHFRFGCLEARAPIERADLHVVLGIVFVARQFLYGDVLRVTASGAQAFFVLELHNGHPLAVVGEKAFVRNVARHGAAERGHAIDQGHIFIPQSGFEPRRNTITPWQYSFPADN
jgi:hypothetical protein